MGACKLLLTASKMASELPALHIEFSMPVE